MTVIYQPATARSSPGHDTGLSGPGSFRFRQSGTVRLPATRVAAGPATEQDRRSAARAATRALRVDRLVRAGHDSGTADDPGVNRSVRTAVFIPDRHAGPTAPRAVHRCRHSGCPARLDGPARRRRCLFNRPAQGGASRHKPACRHQRSEQAHGMGPADEPERRARTAPGSTGHSCCSRRRSVVSGYCNPGT